MIRVYGTSHVSEESLDLVREKIDLHDPEMVAVELDPQRLQSMLGDAERQGPVWARLLELFQRAIGSRTGVMPGEEMLCAYRKAMDEGREVALIDQDIRVTLGKLSEVPRKEKVRAAGELLLGLLVSNRLEFSEVPEDEMIQQLLEETRERFPEIYRVLVEERDRVMADHLLSVQERNPEADIVAFVGAAHADSVREMVENGEIDS